MEIITIPLEGGLMHKDSMGNEGIFVLAKCKSSAGSGVEHSEMNASATDHAKHCNYGFFLTLRKLRQIRPEII
jgi:redox-sensitive bicupin YhaK (pirin superfamily)